MEIILNEYEWAERMIHERDLGKHPMETLSRVARYYYENQYSKREIRKLLDQFLIQSNPDASLFFWSDKLDKITRNANRYPLIQIDGIPVTAGEMERIESLDNSSIKRLAFTLLCVSKYWDLVSVRNNHWVNSSDRDIFAMANVSASSKRQDLMYGKIIEAGLIRQSRKIDNLNLQVLFQDDSESVLVIHDFRNLGYQYLKYLGGPYYECENCGVTTKARAHTYEQSKRKDRHHSGRGRPQRYCAECANAIRTKQRVDAVMRRRRSSM